MRTLVIYLLITCIAVSLVQHCARTNMRQIRRPADLLEDM